MLAVVPWQQLFVLVNALADSYDSHWRKRRRKIGTAFLITFLMRICCSRSQSGYQIIVEEIWENMRINGIPLPQEKPVAASSVCEARQKLDPQVIHDINSEVVDLFLALNDENYRWHDRRLFVVDGSTVHLPPELKEEGFGQMNPGKHYPQGKLSVLMHEGSGVAIDVILDPKGDERELAMRHLETLLPEDVVIYDRGYFGYEILAHHKKKSIDGIFRLPLSRNMTEIQKFIDDKNKPTEIILKIVPSKKQKTKTEKNNKSLKAGVISIRVIRYYIEEQEYVIATTLLDKAIPPIDFAEVYHKRWGVEEHYKSVKTIFSLESFHAKTLRGVLQEIYTTELLLTLTRLIALESCSIFDAVEKEKKTNSTALTVYLAKMFSRMKAKNEAIRKTTVLHKTHLHFPISPM